MVHREWRPVASDEDVDPTGVETGPPRFLPVLVSVLYGGRSPPETYVVPRQPGQSARHVSDRVGGPNKESDLPR